MNEYFALRLKAARLSAGLSLEDLAKNTGYVIKKQSLSLYEKGLRFPKRYTVKCLAKALNVSDGYFDNVSLNIDNDTLYKSLRLCDDTTKNLVSCLIAYKSELIHSMEKDLGISWNFDLWNFDSYDMAKVADSIIVTNKIRSLLEAGIGPIQSLTNTLENHGFIIINSNLLGESFICGTFVKKNRPVIVADFSKYKRSRLFFRYLLAMQLCSLFFPSVSNKDSARFASFLLFPEKALENEFVIRGRTFISNLELIRNSEKYGIPIAVQLREALDLQVIDQSLSYAFSNDLPMMDVNNDVNNIFLELPDREERLQNCIYRN